MSFSFLVIYSCCFLQITMVLKCYRFLFHLKRSFFVERLKTITQDIFRTTGRSPVWAGGRKWGNAVYIILKATIDHCISQKKKKNHSERFSVNFEGLQISAVCRVFPSTSRKPRNSKPRNLENQNQRAAVSRQFSFVLSDKLSETKTNRSNTVPVDDNRYA